MSRIIYPKAYIKEVLINEIDDVVKKHPFLSFILVCAGIEYLGICLDDSCSWTDQGMSKRHFQNTILQLFPPHYSTLKDDLYKSLRCGMTHSHLPGGYSLTELKNSPLKYKDHLIKDNKIIVVEYFYQDFVAACNKVIKTTFVAESKMQKPFLRVG